MSAYAWGRDQWRKFIDSYEHYRRHGGLRPVHAFYRALYYEIKHREPWA